MLRSLALVWFSATLLLAQFFGGTPPASSRPVATFTYTYYVVGYSHASRTALWSAMETDHAQAPAGPCGRPGHFATEPRAEPPVTHKDYANHEGYSRGHLTPNAVAAYSFGCEAAQATFITSNLVPQLQDHNAGVWEALEAAVGGKAGRAGFQEGLVQRAAHVWIYTGPVFDDPGAATLGPKQIWIPSALWKTVLWQDEAGRTWTCSWIIPHAHGIPRDAYMAYATSIEAVHRRTGVNVLGATTGELYRASDAAAFLAWAGRAS